MIDNIHKIVLGGYVKDTMANLLIKLACTVRDTY